VQAVVEISVVSAVDVDVSRLVIGTLVESIVDVIVVIG
jgi:hypothetical protein